MDLSFGPIDADNHYYEALDAFTRHLDPAFRDRGVQVVQQGRHTLLLVGRQALTGSSRTRPSTRSSSPAASTSCSAARSPRGSTRGR